MQRGPSATSTTGTSSGPSTSRPVTDQSTQQIQLLQTQLLNQQAQCATQVQQEKTSAAASLASVNTDTEKKISDAKTEAQSTIWASISKNNIKDMCKKVTASNTSNIQSITSFKDIDIAKMCASVTGNSTIAKYDFSESSAPIQTTRLENDNVVPYCNSNATSNLKYQNEQCVCNQLGPNPVLHKINTTNAGILGIGASNITGYYCMPGSGSSDTTNNNSNNNSNMNNSNKITTNNTNSNNN